MIALLLKSAVAAYTRRDGTFVPPHVDSRTKQQRMDDDMEAQAAWLTAMARSHGHADVDAMLSDDPALFTRLAEQWREQHPELAKAIDHLAKSHPVLQGATRDKRDYSRALIMLGKRRGDQLLSPGEPLPEEAATGEYKKPTVKWAGLTLAIENPAGSVRRGTNRHGVTWEVRYKFAYGEILGSMGVDGDPVDCYLGPNMDGAPMVYVVHQRQVGNWSEYDEDKCMLGFDSEEDARQAFLSCYNDPRFLGPITAMPVGEFVTKVRATREAPAMIKALLFRLPAAG